MFCQERDSRHVRKALLPTVAGRVVCRWVSKGVVGLDELGRRWQTRRETRWGVDPEAREVKPWVVHLVGLVAWLLLLVVFVSQGNIAAVVGLVTLPPILYAVLELLGRALIKNVKKKRGS